MHLCKMRLLALLLFWSSSTFAACPQFSAFGQPVTGATTICRSAYVVHHYDACKAPLLVQEHLDVRNISGVEPRVTFKPDPQLSRSVRSQPSDYSRSGFDKGHLAPAADFSNGTTVMAESFYLSNAVPQEPKFNRGQWKSLEIRARALAAKYSNVYVYTGAIYGDQRIGSGVCVPTHLYKVFIDERTLESVAYLIPNESNVLRFDSYVISVAELEKITKINYTPSLVESDASKLKLKKSAALQGK